MDNILQLLQDILFYGSVAGKLNVMNKKVAIITGATGGIGGACVRLLVSLGWAVYTPVRSLNTNAQELSLLEGVSVTVVAQDSIEALKQYMQTLHSDGIEPDLIILAAGGRGAQGEFYDYAFPGTTLEEQRKQAVLGHIASSVTTKDLFLKALVWVYRDAVLKKMTLVAIGSHASEFSLEQSLEYSEVGYVEAMRQVETLINNRFAGFFKKAFVDKPGLVRTTLTEGELAEVLADPMSVVKEADEYAEELITKTGLL